MVPRMDPTAVYEVQLEKMTGKHQEADVTLKRWDGAEGQVGGPGTDGCPFHRAALEAEAQAADINGGSAKEI